MKKYFKNHNKISQNGKNFVNPEAINNLRTKISKEFWKLNVILICKKNQKENLKNWEKCMWMKKLRNSWYNKQSSILKWSENNDNKYKKWKICITSETLLKLLKIQLIFSMDNVIKHVEIKK